MFLNLYFLVMATSQFIPELRIGYLYTYWGPLVSYLSADCCFTLKQCMIAIIHILSWYYYLIILFILRENFHLI